jgi:divalent metal cation (Fe/Co/Zn/Cd) transporter
VPIRRQRWKPLVVDAAALVRASLRVSVLSAAWTVLSSAASITLGLVDASAVLVALGLIGLVDSAGSVALAFHFLHGVRHERFSEHRERLAHHAVSLGLVVVGLASAAGASYRLLSGDQPRASVAGALVAAASLTTLAVLASRKHVLGSQLGSRGLIGDARLSAIGAAQAGLALAGIALSRGLGAGWADASAALVVGLLATTVGVVTWRAEPSDT